MANYAVVFDNSGNVTIPTWAASGDFTVTIDFTTAGVLGTDGLVGNNPSGSYLAIFSSGRYDIQMSTGVSYSSAGSLVKINTNHTLEVSRVGTLVSYSLKEGASVVDSGTFTNSQTFSIDLIGDTGGLVYEGNINSVILSQAGDDREYLSSVSTGSNWADITNSQDGTLVGLPTDGSQWELIPGTESTGIESTQAAQNSVASASSSIPGAGTITTDILKNNTGTVLASTGSIVANVYDLSDGTLVVRKTGLTSDVAGVVEFTDALINPAVEYLVHVAISTDDGVARITAT